MKYSFRLLFILISATIVLMTSFVGGRYYLSESANQEHLQNLSDNIATRIAGSVQPTIWNIYNRSLDRKYSENITSAILDAEFLDPHVIGISVYGNFGHVYMARYRGEQGKTVDHSPAAHSWAVQTAAKRSLINVKQGTMTIGNVLVLVSDAPNQPLMKKILFIELGQILVISLFFVLVLFYAINKALVEPARALEEANIELEEFSYRVSHDLRSPLISSLTLLGMIEKDIEKENLSGLKAPISMSIRSLEQLERLLGDIYNILVIRSREEDDEEIDVSSIINDSLNLLSHLQDATEIEMIGNYTENNNVTTKPTRLRMIIENLLSNAIKYSDKSKDKSYIKFTTSRDSKAYIFEIEDNGLGIPKGSRDDVFQMFKRFHPKTSFGSGLGLYLVKKSAMRIGAQIEYIPIDGGTKFKLTLPLI